MWKSTDLLKYSSKHALKEWYDFGSRTSLMFAVETTPPFPQFLAVENVYDIQWHPKSSHLAFIHYDVG